MRRSLLSLPILVLLAGCGGSSDGDDVSRFAGTYSRTWTNLESATDTGTASWTVRNDGTITGTDTDPGRDTTFNIAGRIDADGNVTTTSTPVGGGEGASLNGRLTFGSGELAGTLTWGVEPPLSYRYAFTRQSD